MVRTRLYEFSRKVAILAVKLVSLVPKQLLYDSYSGRGSRGGRQPSIPMLASTGGMLRGGLRIRRREDCARGRLQPEGMTMEDADCRGQWRECRVGVGGAALHSTMFTV